jgi:hypothetical protein
LKFKENEKKKSRENLGLFQEKSKFIPGINWKKSKIIGFLNILILDNLKKGPHINRLE